MRYVTDRRYQIGAAAIAAVIIVFLLGRGSSPKAATDQEQTPLVSVPASVSLSEVVPPELGKDAVVATEVVGADESVVQTQVLEYLGLHDSDPYCIANGIKGLECINSLITRGSSNGYIGGGEESSTPPDAPTAEDMFAVDGVPQPPQLNDDTKMVAAGQPWPVAIPFSMPVNEVGETRNFTIWFGQSMENVLLQKVGPDDELISLTLVHADGTSQALNVAALGISPMYCNSTGALDLDKNPNTGDDGLSQALIARGISPTCIVNQDGTSKDVTEAIAHNIWAGYIGSIKAGDSLVFEIKDQYGLEIGVSVLLSNQGPLDLWTRNLITGANMAPGQ